MPTKSLLPAERFVGAMRSGVRYLVHAPPLKAVVLRTLAFTVFGSAIWALLPLVVKTELLRGPSAYGTLLGAMGVAAIAGTILLPRLSGRTSLDRIIVVGTVLVALVCFATAYVPIYAVLMIVVPLGGLSWMIVLSSLSVATREVVPSWLKGVRNEYKIGTT